MTRFEQRLVEDIEREQRQVESLLGLSITQLALGVGVLGLLGAVFFTPILDNNAKRIARSDVGLPSNIDRTITGAVEKPKSVKRYIIRRSVMNPNPQEPCYIYDDGTREGSC